MVEKKALQTVCQTAVMLVPSKAVKMVEMMVVWRVDLWA